LEKEKGIAGPSARITTNVSPGQAVCPNTTTRRRGQEAEQRTRWRKFRRASAPARNGSRCAGKQFGESEIRAYYLPMKHEPHTTWEIPEEEIAARAGVRLWWERRTRAPPGCRRPPASMVVRRMCRYRYSAGALPERKAFCKKIRR
jgi:hypothetical protein